MNAIEEVRRTAAILHWSVQAQRDSAMLWRGDRAITLDVTASGAISSARRYRFRRISELHQTDIAPSRNTKATVLAWLASD